MESKGLSKVLAQINANPMNLLLPNVKTKFNYVCSNGKSLNTSDWNNITSLFGQLLRNSEIISNEECLSTVLQNLVHLCDHLVVDKQYMGVISRVLSLCYAAGGILYKIVYPGFSNIRILLENSPINSPFYWFNIHCKISLFLDDGVFPKFCSLENIEEYSMIIFNTYKAYDQHLIQIRKIVDMRLSLLNKLSSNAQQNITNDLNMLFCNSYKHLIRYYLTVFAMVSNDIKSISEKAKEDIIQAIAKYIRYSMKLSNLNGDLYEETLLDWEDVLSFNLRGKYSSKLYILKTFVCMSLDVISKSEFSSRTCKTASKLFLIESEKFIAEYKTEHFVLPILIKHLEKQSIGTKTLPNLIETRIIHFLKNPTLSYTYSRERFGLMAALNSFAYIYRCFDEPFKLSEKVGNLWYEFSMLKKSETDSTDIFDGIIRKEEFYRLMQSFADYFFVEMRPIIALKINISCLRFCETNHIENTSFLSPLYLNISKIFECMGYSNYAVAYLRKFRLSVDKNIDVLLHSGWNYEYILQLCKLGEYAKAEELLNSLEYSTNLENSNLYSYRMSKIFYLRSLIEYGYGNINDSVEMAKRSFDRMHSIAVQSDFKRSVYSGASYFKLLMVWNSSPYELIYRFIYNFVELCLWMSSLHIYQGEFKQFKFYMEYCIEIAKKLNHQNAELVLTALLKLTEARYIKLLDSSSKDILDDDLSLVIRGVLSVDFYHAFGQKDDSFKCLIDIVDKCSPNNLDNVLREKYNIGKVDGIPPYGPVTINNLQRLVASRIIINRLWVCKDINAAKDHYTSFKAIFATSLVESDNFTLPLFNDSIILFALAKLELSLELLKIDISYFIPTIESISCKRPNHKISSKNEKINLKLKKIWEYIPRYFRNIQSINKQHWIIETWCNFILDLLFVSERFMADSDIRGCLLNILIFCYDTSPDYFHEITKTELILYILDRKNHSSKNGTDIKDLVFFQNLKNLPLENVITILSLDKNRSVIYNAKYENVLDFNPMMNAFNISSKCVIFRCSLKEKGSFLQSLSQIINESINITPFEPFMEKSRCELETKDETRIRRYAKQMWWDAKYGVNSKLKLYLESIEKEILSFSVINMISCSTVLDTLVSHYVRNGISKVISKNDVIGSEFYIKLHGMKIDFIVSLKSFISSHIVPIILNKNSINMSLLTHNLSVSDFKNQIIEDLNLDFLEDMCMSSFFSTSMAADLIDYLLNKCFMTAISILEEPSILETIDSDSFSNELSNGIFEVVLRHRKMFEIFFKEYSKKVSYKSLGDQSNNVSLISKEVCLITDKRLSRIPWEGLPSLNNGNKMCRTIKITLMEIEKTKSFKISNSIFFMLNPGGDLVRTQEIFKDSLESKCGEECSSMNWSGFVNKSPINVDYEFSDANLRDCIAKCDTFLYFGHGGGEQYINGAKLVNYKKLPNAMLFGCSSGYLSENGDFDFTGTPLNYLEGGSDFVIGCLWDVTDGDLDRASVSILRDYGLLPESTYKISNEIEIVRDNNKDKRELDCTLDLVNNCKETRITRCRNNRSSGEYGRNDISQCVADARKCCKLEYITGSAIVIYKRVF